MEAQYTVCENEESSLPTPLCPSLFGHVSEPLESSYRLVVYHQHSQELRHLCSLFRLSNKLLGSIRQMLVYGESKKLESQRVTERENYTSDKTPRQLP